MTSAALLLCLLAQSPAASATTTYERPVIVSASGPQKLAVDATLLAGSAPFRIVTRGTGEGGVVAENGLSDLRLTGPDGREVPYLLVYPAMNAARWVRASVQPIAPTDKTSGFEADLGSVDNVNGIDLRGMAGPFMKRFSLEASADRQHWTQAIPEGTLFDMPERRLRQTDATFPAGPYRYFRLTWDDTNSGRVFAPPAIAVKLADDSAPPAPLTLPVRFERRPSEPGRSRYHLTLPGRRLPIVALRLDAAGSYVYRNVTATEARLAEWQATPVTIGAGVLVRDQAGLALRLPMEQPSETEIDLVVEDRNNPALDLHGVSAELAALPWIYFEASGPLVARYGDLRLQRPSYDLEAARPTVQIETLPEAHWGAPTESPVTPKPAPAPDAAALTGGPLDASPFRYSRAIASGKAELVALPLDAAVLAHSAGPGRQFADVRIVDDRDRQVPRLVERRPEPLLMPLRAEPSPPVARELQPRPGTQRSTYRIALPYASLPEARLTIATTARVFQRPVQIGYERPPDRGHRDPWFQVIGSATWTRAEDAAAVLTFPLSAPPPEVNAVTLVVDEGDNSALPISSVQLLLPAYRLRFVRPASSARLLYGNAASEAPRYDLALLAPAVLGAPAADVTMAAEVAATPAAPPRLISQTTFWIVLALAVAVLLGVLVSLLRTA